MNGQIISRKDMAERVGAQLSKYSTQIAESIPSGLAMLKPERVVRLVMNEAGRNADLLACEPASIVGGLLTAASLGLEIGAHLGHAYLVAFSHTNKKTGVVTKRAQFIPGYKGLVKLALQSGEIDAIAAHVVREGDEFRVLLGSDHTIHHVPKLDGSAKSIAFYAVAFLHGGGHAFDRPMTRADVDRIKSRAKSQSGPWSTDYDEMARKTVVRRLCKLLPLTANAATAAEIDGAVEGGKIPPRLPEIDWFDDGASEGEEIAEAVPAGAIEAGAKKHDPSTGELPEDPPVTP